MLFSEPKIPQFCALHITRTAKSGVSVLFSEPKIPQFAYCADRHCHRWSVSVLFSEPKIPQFRWEASTRIRLVRVSVLFSEPKIPQFERLTVQGVDYCGFSALQRAENSSIPPRRSGGHCGILFQCSSASRKFLNCGQIADARRRGSEFQCSSASRKFLNFSRTSSTVNPYASFSALQRAENSSISILVSDKRPAPAVSVLFSEPKIPQFIRKHRCRNDAARFSALQRAENSSIS